MEIDDIECWAKAVVQTTSDVAKEIETDDNITQMDSRLAHLLEAKKSIKARWKTQRTNRRFRK